MSRRRRVFRRTLSPGRLYAPGRSLLLLALFLPLLCWTLPPRSIRGYPVTAIGYVREEGTGKPIAGAVLTATAGDFRCAARTDERGRFRLVVPSLGSGDEPPEVWEDCYEVDVQADGYLPGHSEIYAPVPCRMPQALGPVTLAPVAATVSVSAVDEEGRPVEFSGGWLQMGPIRPARAVSNSRETFPGIPGPVSVSVWTEDGRWGGASITIPKGPRRPVSIEVPVVAGREIRGLVRDETGRPLPGAAVWAQRLGAGAPSFTRYGWRLAEGTPLGVDYFRAVTAEDGSFRLTVPPEGECVLTALLEHYSDPTGRWHRLDPLKFGEVELVLARHPRMRIRLLNRDGSAAAGLTFRSRRGPFWRPIVFTTDENGVCEVVASKRDAPNVAYVLRRDGRVVGGVVLPDKWSSGDEPVTCTVAPKEVLQLAVVDAVTGAPIPDVAVMGCGVLTDERGRCTAETSVTERHGRLPWPGLYRAGYEDFELGPDYRPEEMDVIKMVPQATVRIRIVCDDGPCPGVWIEGVGAFTDEDGRAEWRERPGRPLSRLRVHLPDGSGRTIQLRRPWRPRMLLEWMGFLDPQSRSKFVPEPGEKVNLGTYRLESLPR